MSTRARIGYKTRNNNERYHGCVISSHVQMDGDSLLEVLNENFNTRKKAFSLCVKGFFSSLHQYVERNCEQTEHEKANSTERRNESLEDFLNEENNHTEYIEYLYLWSKHDGRFQWKRFAMQEENVQEESTRTAPVFTHIPACVQEREYNIFEVIRAILFNH